MSLNEPDHVQQLRAAVQLSPDNTPLRQALADALMGAGLVPEAITEYKAGLAKSPDEVPMKLGLARAFFADGKQSHALVILEDIVRTPRAPAQAFVLHAKILAGIGEVAQAVEQYKRGVSIDPTAGDTAFALKMGIRNEPQDDLPFESASDDDEVSDGRIRETFSEGDGGFFAEIEKPTITFADVGGMESLKEEIRLKIIHPLTHSEMYKAYGKSIGGGILMYGPPGCGKTHLARATAGEVKAGFISVGIHDVLDMWIGNSERNLHQLFEQARRNAPCVLFFDEVDALGASRSDMKTSAGRHLINQFLSELDGVNSSNEGVLILGATNAPWHLDSAFRRPGRFDRILFVPPPDQEARSSILRLQLRGKPVSEIDYDAIAKKCDGFSGADLKAVVDLTIEDKLRDAMKSGTPMPIATKDIQKALSRQKPTTREWFSTARNYALYSNQGGAYDDILSYLKLK
jgi:AAA+ superfamily predicted ATPase